MSGKERADLAWRLARVAYWLTQRSGYTRAQAADILANIATQLDSEETDRALKWRCIVTKPLAKRRL